LMKMIAAMANAIFWKRFQSSREYQACTQAHAIRATNNVTPTQIAIRRSFESVITTGPGNRARIGSNGSRSSSSSQMRVLAHRGKQSLHLQAPRREALLVQVPAQRLDRLAVLLEPVRPDVLAEHRLRRAVLRLDPGQRHRERRQLLQLGDRHLLRP